MSRSVTWLLVVAAAISFWLAVFGITSFGWFFLAFAPIAIPCLYVLITYFFEKVVLGRPSK